MKFKNPGLPVFATVSYAVFAAFGIAVWQVLLFVALPHATTPLQTFKDLLAVEPGGALLGFHAVATIVAATFMVVLLLKPLRSVAARLAAAAAAVLFAVIAWLVFWSDTAVLPSVAAITLVWHYFNPRPQKPSEA